jgi:hypothetical protein
MAISRASGDRTRLTGRLAFFYQEKNITRTKFRRFIRRGFCLRRRDAGAEKIRVTSEMKIGDQQYSKISQFLLVLSLTTHLIP